MRTALLAISLAAVLVLASGCGDDADALDAREAKAARVLAEEFQGATPTTAQRDNGTCLAKHLVRGAGVDTLVSSGMLTEDLAFNDDLPEAVPPEVASAYADAVVACQDVRAEIEERRTAWPDASDEDVDAYVACMAEVDPELLRRAVIESALRGGEDEASQAYLDATAPCTELLS